MSRTIENGVNMLAVKKQNRGSILQTIQQSGSISRKDIARRLRLTPAAITMITGELLEEGLLSQSGTDKREGRKGRREVLLQIAGEHYAALGVYITRHKFRLLCVDLNNEILFESLVYTADCQKKASAILDKVTEIIKAKLREYDVLRSRTIVGLGVSINGIVDSKNGISINPFQVWEEKEVHVAAILEEKLSIPVLLTNNICSLMHGESLLGSQQQKTPMLFIKYGPGLGAAHSLDNGTQRVLNYKAIQMGHVISDSNGIPCVCGGCGCLETIVHYDAIENTVKGALSEKRTPILWEMTGGNSAKVTMAEIIKAYDAGERVVEQTLARVVFYLCLTIKNSLTLFDPESIVLYGEPFEHEKFRQAIQDELDLYAGTDRVSFSRYNMELETSGPAATAISLFYENGGILERKEPEPTPEPIAEQ